MQSEKFLEKINKQLLRGELPMELDFREKEQEVLDISKIQYQSFYRTFDYAASKFPTAWADDELFSKIIEMNIPKLTPLQELEQREYDADSENEKAIN